MKLIEDNSPESQQNYQDLNNLLEEMVGLIQDNGNIAGKKWEIYHQEHVRNNWNNSNSTDNIAVIGPHILFSLIHILCNWDKDFKYTKKEKIQYDLGFPIMINDNDMSDKWSMIMNDLLLSCAKKDKKLQSATFIKDNGWVIVKCQENELDENGKMNIYVKKPKDNLLVIIKDLELYKNKLKQSKLLYEALSMICRDFGTEQHIDDVIDILKENTDLLKLIVLFSPISVQEVMVPKLNKIGVDVSIDSIVQALSVASKMLYKLNLQGIIQNDNKCEEYIKQDLNLSVLRLVQHQKTQGLESIILNTKLEKELKDGSINKKNKI